MKRISIFKGLLILVLVFMLSINSFTAVVSDNDGSTFITKAEFDSIKNNFQSQIDGYNKSIDSKIEGAIASYLAGIKISTTENFTPWWGSDRICLVVNTDRILSDKDLKIGKCEVDFSWSCSGAPGSATGATGWFFQAASKRPRQYSEYYEIFRTDASRNLSYYSDKYDVKCAFSWSSHVSGGYATYTPVDTLYMRFHASSSGIGTNNTTLGESYWCDDFYYKGFTKIEATMMNMRSTRSDDNRNVFTKNFTEYINDDDKVTLIFDEGTQASYLWFDDWDKPGAVRGNAAPLYYNGGSIPNAATPSDAGLSMSGTGWGVSGSTGTKVDVIAINWIAQGKWSVPPDGTITADGWRELTFKGSQYLKPSYIKMTALSGYNKQVGDCIGWTKSIVSGLPFIECGKFESLEFDVDFSGAPTDMILAFNDEGFDPSVKKIHEYGLPAKINKITIDSTPVTTAPIQLTAATHKVKIDFVDGASGPLYLKVGFPSTYTTSKRYKWKLPSLFIGTKAT